nr:PREDICTED: uncharacterized protein LOC105662297 [Megachile rotundata]
MLTWIFLKKQTTGEAKDTTLTSKERIGSDRNNTITRQVMSRSIRSLVGHNKDKKNEERNRNDEIMDKFFASPRIIACLHRRKQLHPKSAFSTGVALITLHRRFH